MRWRINDFTSNYHSIGFPMNLSLIQQSYGKSCVRLSHLTREGDQHHFVQLTAEVLLDGDFDAAYSEGNNANVVPTDTMKNTVYAIAKLHGVKDIESFAIALAQRFVNNFEHVARADVAITQQLWERIDLDGSAHGHAFIGGGKEENTCHAVASDQLIDLSSGVSGIQILKTTESGFSGFLKDEYTSLEETQDRIFATTITAEWACNQIEHDWTATRTTIRNLMLDVFCHNYSPSVQKTLYEMAESVLNACPEIDMISLNMPNQHHLLADIGKLNLENENEVFVPTGEPFGVISATVSREEE